jgi:hypothetical protein
MARQARCGGSSTSLRFARNDTFGRDYPPGEGGFAECGLSDFGGRVEESGAVAGSGFEAVALGLCLGRLGPVWGWEWQREELAEAQPAVRVGERFAGSGPA